MITDKEIEAEGLKAGYTGKITPYIRKQLEKKISEQKEQTETKLSNHKTPIKKSSKKRIIGIIKTIGAGTKKTGKYLSDCSGRYIESETVKKPVKKPKKPIKKPVKKPKKPRKTVKKTPSKSKKRVSVKKVARDFEKELMDIM